MVTTPLTRNFKIQLIRDIGKSTGADRQQWAEFIILNDIPLEELVDILYMNTDISTRFAWLLGDICQMDAKRVRGIIPQMVQDRPLIKIKNFHRTIAKSFQYAGVPETIEGEAIDLMVNWLLDPKIIVSTKNHALFALNQLRQKYPTLKIELQAILEDQLDKNSLAFKKRATQVLQQLQPFQS